MAQNPNCPAEQVSCELTDYTPQPVHDRENPYAPPVGTISVTGCSVCGQIWLGELEPEPPPDSEPDE